MSQIKVTELNIYPIKGTMGTSLPELVINDTGPKNDRRWVIIDETGKFISQRTHPSLAIVKSEVVEEKLKLIIPHMEPILIDTCNEGDMLEAVIWKDTCHVIEQSKQASQALSDYLKIPCKLVGLAKNTIRPVNPKYTVTDKDRILFADGFPFLITSQTSLNDLNSKLSEAVPMNRFRPNIVVEGLTPYEEDNWKRLHIGNVFFEAVKPCSRCIVITVDQLTGVKGKEPLKTLAKYRNSEKGIMFGMNLIHCNEGVIKVGDNLEVIL